ncbi:flagellar basal-body rod modification protein FlgD [Fulvimarina manganoxydans]|uniref:Basal-body rod modification protein FlgD n=1 Tax=Fulvimarina manganoxydans TaxID=937218 RepID=A0A1W2BJZ8_9HYPH|nr:flagellar hook assembly protein FlgD [Fulvimarina manganoxydans]SMC73191.1 flagellar basal-body rod modification protein FlgD [Fulvimarina manganoxydans]
MSVSAVSSAPKAAEAGATGMTQASAKAGMDYDAFLKLLVAEMNNQDPLNPTDSTEYVAQFASFSTVEQSIQTNKRLDTMMAVSALTQADALIGRTMTSSDGSVSGEVSSIRAVDGGIQATLTSGKTIMLGGGVAVS